jgi:hypothetical protein
MALAMLVFVAVLFFVLTPGVLVRLPPNGSKMAVAAVHALVFALVYQLTHKMVWRALYEAFQGNDMGAVAAVGAGAPMKKPMPSKKQTPSKKQMPSKRMKETLPQ